MTNPAKSRIQESSNSSARVGTRTRTSTRTRTTTRPFSAIDRKTSPSFETGNILTPSTKAATHRQAWREVHQHPPSALSFDKSNSYSELIENELNTLLNAHSKPSPQYAIEAARDTVSAGSPLIESGLLAASKHEEACRTDLFYPSSYTKSKQGNRLLFYRPEPPHDYLTSPQYASATDFYEALKHGRPTRTTVLRARARCGSAPVEKTRERRALRTKLEVRAQSARLPRGNNALQQVQKRSNESAYSFLIGARYNRAHCLDANSVRNHGIYMPRGNPLGAFLLDSKRQLHEPSAPPADQSSARENQPISARGYYDVTGALTAAENQLQAGRKDASTQTTWGH